MLTIPPPSPSVATPNAQSPQLLATPNARSLQALQGYARMGMKVPGGLTTPGAAPSWPQAGFAASGAPPAGLSANPLGQQNNLAAMIAALQGGQR